MGILQRDKLKDGRAMAMAAWKGGEPGHIRQISKSIYVMLHGRKNNLI